MTAWAERTAGTDGVDDNGPEIDGEGLEIDGERAVEVLGRAGLVSRGFLWLTIGVLAIRVAALRSPTGDAQPDKKGALRTIASQPAGRWLVVALGLGFLAMTVWSVYETVQRRQGSRGGHWGHRAAAAGRAATYVALSATTLPAAVAGRAHEAGDKGGGGAAARAFDWPGGRLLVGAVALGLFAAAGWNIRRVVGARYEKHWDRSRLRRRTSLARAVEVPGYLGHALVFALIGWFLFFAAAHDNPSEPKTLDESLAQLVRGPKGTALAVVVAVGVLAWAACSFGQAVWRKVPED